MAEYIRLGELLVSSGLISDEQLEQALLVQSQEQTHQRLGTLLIALGLITEDHLCRALSVQLGLDTIDLSVESIDPKAVAAVPEQWAVRHQVVPVRLDEDAIYLAASDPTNRWAVQDIHEVTGKDVRMLVAPESDVRVQLRRQYESLRNRQKQATAGKPQLTMMGGTPGAAAATASGVPTGNFTEDQGAVKIVDTVFQSAIDKKTSDVALLAQDDGIIVRFRIDGVFQDIGMIPKSLQLAVVSRIKILCQLDVTEHRKPMDGRTRFTLDETEVDLRIVTFPTMYGESVVIRILDRMDGLPQLDTLGLRPPQLEILLEHARRPQGLLLLTGPTGSGKTTTIYAALNEIYTPQLNILTLEDPVEYEMQGVGQVQIDERAGLTFAKGMKSFLRAAPNVIFIGEVRDLETAQLAFQAGLTGHLVLSTLHTNDAVSTVLRLLSMGVEPFLIASTLSLVVAQRLIRRICPDCKRRLQPSPGILRMLRITEEQANQHVFYGGVGCPKCDGTGYKGRIGLYEVLALNDEIRELILHGGREQEIRKAVRAAGVHSLRQEALTRAFQGHTTLEEVVRVTDVRESLEDRCPRCGLPLPAPGRPCPKCAALAKTAENVKAKKAAASAASAAPATATRPSAPPTPTPTRRPASPAPTPKAPASVQQTPPAPAPAQPKPQAQAPQRPAVSPTPPTAQPQRAASTPPPRPAAPQPPKAGPAPKPPTQ